MRRSERWTRAAQLCACAAGVALLAVACGGKSHKSGGGNTTPGTSGSGKTFANFRVTWDAPDYMDPALAYKVASWQIFFNVYEGLVTYKHVAGAAGTQLVPALAKAMPTVNAAGTQYKITLRPNLKYSNGTPVKASDFRATIERDFKMNSPGVGFYSNIVGVGGATGFAKKPKGHIKGIVSNDAARTITISLVKPQADFLYVLALPFSSPVPAGTPASDQSAHPPASTGPYMVQSYKANKSFVIVRNPSFNGQIPTVPKGNPDKLTGQIITDPVAAAQTVISGSSDYDQLLLPTDRLSQIEKKYGKQVKLSPCSCTWYFFMNFRLKPFDSLQARQAVNYAIDRNALVQLFGGLGQPTQNFLPPNYPQYKKIDYYKYDLQKAKQLVQQSGTAGTSVKVIGINEDPSKSIVQYLANQLTKIGYKASVRLVASGPYFTVIGNQSTKAQIGYTDWLQDYPYPTDWFNILLNGENITPTHNNNPGDVDVKPLNKVIDRLANQPSSRALSSSTNNSWANLDQQYVVKYSAVAPYVNRTESDFFSKKIDLGCYYFHPVANFDYSTICMK